MAMTVQMRLAAAAISLVVIGCAPRQPQARTPASPTTTTSSAPLEEMAVLPTSRPSTIQQPRIIKGVDRSTLIYPCRHARPETLAEAVTGLLSPQGTVQASAAINTLIVVDNAETVESISEALREMDHSVAQLLIESRVVEVKLDSDLEYELSQLLTVPVGNNAFFQSGGVTLTTPGGSPTVGQGLDLNVRPWSSDGKRLDSFIRFLITRGKAKILSSPNLIVSPGTEGSIITGQEVPVQSATVVSGSVNTTTQFKRVGIKLRVNLLQIADDTARVEVNPEVSSVTGFTVVTKDGITNPIIAIRNVSSTLSLKDGEVLTVGGLLQTEDSQIVRGVPLLMDIPVLGTLFQSRRNVQVRTQLVFFLRAHILQPGQVGSTRVHKPGVGLEHLDKQMGLELPKGNGAYPVTAEEVLNLKEGK